MADEPELREGSDGEWVSYLQNTLTSKGYDPGAIDGNFGPRTEAAVKAYQEAYGLTVDGIVGPITWGSLTEGQATDADGSENGDGADDRAGGSLVAMDEAGEENIEVFDVEEFDEQANEEEVVS